MDATRLETIPAFLSIDVEPDGFQPSRGDPGVWSGYEAVHEFSRTLREALARASGATPTFGWYVRMDPQIEEVFGRADVAVTEFSDRFASLRADGDYFGVHSHPLRWSAERGLWVHDFGDREWARACTSRSLDAFERSTGSPARVFRAGAGFLNDDIVEVLDERGVELELSLEAVAAPRGVETVPSGVDVSPIVGEYADCETAPRIPYRPDPRDFRRRGGADARRITLVPVSTGPRFLPPSAWSLRMRHLLGKTTRRRSVRVLAPSAAWKHARHFWDLAAHRLSTMERPYLSIALRTNARHSALTAQGIRVLSALPGHALGKRLRFVNPLDAIEALTSREAPFALEVT